MVTPPPGVTTMTASLGDARAADPEHSRHEWGPFAPQPLPRHLPIAGEVTYRYTPGEVIVEYGRFATESTHVAFSGTTAYGDRSRLPFHVTSSDWQESDQVLAGIITDFGSPTGPVAFGGRGEFDGVMTGAFRSPRVEGHFTGEDLRALDTLWGGGSARIVVENSYVDVRDGVVRLGDSEIRADGLFSLGYPRADGGEEINARIRVARRDLDSLRHAFGIDEYPVSGLLSGEFHLTGDYQRPIGFGGMTIDDGVAYGEPFQKRDVVAAVRRHRRAPRQHAAGEGHGRGHRRGLRRVGFDLFVQRRRPAHSGRAARVSRVPRAPLSGLAEFTASGSGTFDVPRNDFRFRVNDLFVGEEGVGQVSGTLALRGNELSGEIDVASPRLAITGTGRIALTPQADAELTFRFHDSSLDPYVRLFVPRLSPFTTAVASGSIRVVGELADFDHLLVDGTVDSLDMRLFDYALKNAAPIRIALDRQQVKVDELQLVGDDTRLRVSGTVGLRERAHRAARRRATRTSASCRGSSATSAARAAPSWPRRSTVRSTSRCSPAARRSPAAASATSRCPTRSTPSTA